MSKCEPPPSPIRSPKKASLPRIDFLLTMPSSQFRGKDKKIDCWLPLVGWVERVLYEQTYQGHLGHFSCSSIL